MVRKQRGGFTLVEMLVVIAIIGVLVGLLLPAVQMAREAGRRAACVNNQRQLATAMMSFETSKKRYPGYQEVITPAGRPASWAAAMLGQLDREDLMDLWNSKITDVPLGDESLTPTLEIMLCPSRPTTLAGAPLTSYVANAGFCPRDTDPAPFDNLNNSLEMAQKPANGIFHDRILFPQIKVTAIDIRDGLGSTLLFSENLLATTWSSIGSPLAPGAIVGLDTNVYPRIFYTHNRFGATFVWCYASQTTGPFDPLPAPIGAIVNAQSPPLPRMKINGQILNGPDPGVAPPNAEWARPSSFHPNGVNAAFADGRVQFLRNELAYHVYQQLMTPQGTKSFMPQRQRYVLNDEDYSQ